MNQTIKFVLFLFTLFAIAGFVSSRLDIEQVEAANTTYYVDASAGNDGNNGTSTSTPWKTMSKVNSTTFQPGDQVLFKRGQTFTITGNGMLLNGDGNSTSRITLGAYGTGNAPTLSNTNSSNKYIYVVGVWGKFWTVKDLRIVSTAGNVIEDGIRVWNGDVIIENNEICGIVDSANNALCASSMDNKFGVAKGVKMHGSNSVIRNNNIHDLSLFVNTIGGNDDVGSLGVEVTQNGATVTAVKIYNNTFKNLKPKSYDYVTDGAAIEIFDNVTDLEVFNNMIESVDSVTEIGGTSSGKTISNVRFHHNVILNPYIIAFLNNGGDYPVSFSDIKFQNNTIVKNTAESRGYGIGFWYAPAAGKVFFVNNIVYYRNTPQPFGYIYQTTQGAWSNTTLTHSNNLYDLNNIGGANNTAVNFTLNATASLEEKYTTNLKFVNAASDFHLQSGSDAIDKGTNLSFSSDKEGNAIPSGSLPDIGAYEYQGVVTPPAVCGNGITETGETCDDSNTKNYDSCASDCKNSCGSGQVWEGVGQVCKPAPKCKADYVIDGIVNIADFSAFGGKYKQGVTDCGMDLIGGDCKLESPDFAEFGQVYKVSGVCAL
jgi:cysteine-rich repeat protein